MTDTPTFDNRDEDADLLASLYLDGEASADEAARVEASPALLARVEALRAIAAVVAEPVASPGASVRADHLAAALDLFDDTMGSGAAPLTAASTISSSGHRAAKTAGSTADTGSEAESNVVTLDSRRRGLPAWLGAAAVSVLVVGGLGFLVANGGDDDAAETAALSADDASTDDASDDGDAASSSPSRVLSDDDAMEDEAMVQEEAMETEAMEEAEQDLAAEADAMEDEAEELAGVDAATEAIRIPVPFTIEPGELALDAFQRQEIELIDVGFSQCFDSPAASELFASFGDPTGFAFVVIGSDDFRELFLFEDADEPTAKFLSQDCTLIPG